MISEECATSVNAFFCRQSLWNASSNRYEQRLTKWKIAGLSSFHLYLLIKLDLDLTFSFIHSSLGCRNALYELLFFLRKKTDKLFSLSSRAKNTKERSKRKGETR